MQLLVKGSANDRETATKTWSLDFLLSPLSLHWSPMYPYRLSHVKFQRNQLDPADQFSPSAKVRPKYLSSGKRAEVNIPASIFFRSVGYKSLPLPGLEELGIEFDSSRGVIPNDGFGRITSSTDSGDKKVLPDGSTINLLPGLYCAGWVKRGPTGVIATTMMDAFTTADIIAADLEGQTDLLRSSTGQGWDAVRLEAESRGLRPTTWRDWERIDTAEKERGKQRGKPREKFTSVEEMLDVLS